MMWSCHQWFLFRVVPPDNLTISLQTAYNPCYLVLVSFRSTIQQLKYTNFYFHLVELLEDCRTLRPRYDFIFFISFFFHFSSIVPTLFRGFPRLSREISPLTTPMILPGATYNAIEGHFRKIRKEAVQLLEEQRAGAGAVPTSSAAVPKTPRKARVSKKQPKAEAGLVVLGGRVRKPSGTAKRGKAIKKEFIDDDVDASAPADTATDFESAVNQAEIPFSLSFARAEDMWLSSEDSYASFGV